MLDVPGFLAAAELAADPVTEGASTLIQFGVLGVLATAALWFFWKAWRREVARADAAEAALAALNAKIIADIVPALTRSSDVEREYVEHLRLENTRRRSE